MDSITISDPDHHGIKTPDKEGRVYLSQDLAKERVHVYAVRAENAPDPDVEGAAQAIEAVLDDVDDDAGDQLRAALGALNRVGGLGTN